MTNNDAAAKVETAAKQAKHATNNLGQAAELVAEDVVQEVVKRAPNRIVTAGVAFAAGSVFALAAHRVITKKFGHKLQDVNVPGVSPKRVHEPEIVID